MSVVEKAKKVLQKIEKENKKLNIILQVNPHLLEEAKRIDSKKNKGRLAGYLIGIKSNINVKGLMCSCASETLKDYQASYDATVIENIKAEDGLIVGMLNCDEFACGSSGETSAFGPTQNPTLPGYVPGGSSSGSAAAVAAGFCDMALGSDTGGSIRVPAAFCSVVGVKPSYGCVSRYGLVDLAMSLDQIGPLARTVEDAALLLEVIKGKDERDTTTVESAEIKLKKPKQLTVGLVSVHGVHEGIQTRIESSIAKALAVHSWKKQDVSLKYIDLALQTYHPLVWAEFFSATRRFDGRKYGKRIEESAGEEVLRRIFGGSEITRAEFEGRYYHKALEVKELIAKEFSKAFEKVDCLIMPTTAVLPWKLGTKISAEQMYAVDALAIPANLAGVCALSLPVGTVDGKPVGLQVICNKGEESLLFSVAREIERLVA